MASSSKKVVEDKQTLLGKKPVTVPPRTVDFDELESNMVDVLVDAIKYIATTSGITIALYSQILQGYLKIPAISSSTSSQILVFAPLLCWFCAIVGTVVGIYPRQYKASTDLEKQDAINSIRQTKAVWLKVVLCFFVSGFALFIYIIGAQISHIYPFHW